MLLCNPDTDTAKNAIGKQVEYGNTVDCVRGRGTLVALKARNSYAPFIIRAHGEEVEARFIRLLPQYPEDLTLYELLRQLQEECAEVIQECSKIRRGKPDHLEEEIADVVNVLNTMARAGHIDRKNIKAIEKAKYTRWWGRIIAKEEYGRENE